jgi:pyruvate kinase
MSLENQYSNQIKVFTTYVPGMSINELGSLVEQGMAGVRFIYKETEAVSFISKVKTYEGHFNSVTNRKFLVMIDLPGTKPRIGYLDTPITLKRSMPLNLSIYKSAESIHITNLDKEKFQKIAVNDRILIADDSIELKVTKKEETYLQCISVLTNGILRAGRSIVFPDSEIKNSALSAHDRKLLSSFDLCKYNFKLAISFCHSNKIVQTLTENYDIDRKNIIPKIETVMSKDALSEIIRGCEYAMLGRGDLSVVNSASEWFVFQLLFIKTCQENFVEPIVGTGIFPSLSQNNRPKISEISDVGFLLKMGVTAFLIADDVSFTNPLQVLRQINELNDFISKNELVI